MSDDRCEATHDGIPCFGIRNHGPVIRDMPGGGQQAWEHYGRGVYWEFLGARTSSGELVLERT